MEPTDVALLIVAGIAAGIVNGFAGGGSLITFPALIATGLSPVSANVTNSLSVVPGYAASAYGTRTDLADFPVFNEVYREFFQEPYPARTTVGVSLPGGLLVEIEAVARIGT